MVVRADFAKENPRLVQSLLKEYDKSVSWTIKNPGKAGALVEKHSLGLQAEIVEKAIPVSNYTFIPADTAKNSIEELLQLFLDNEKTSIGGKLPEEEFYYKTK